MYVAYPYAITYIFHSIKIIVIFTSGLYFFVYFLQATEIKFEIFQQSSVDISISMKPHCLKNVFFPKILNYTKYLAALYENGRSRVYFK